MPELSESLRAWGTDDFPRILKAEIECLPPGTLPLHLGTTQGGMVDDSDITATVIRHTETEGVIEARVGVFFQEIVGGCSCGDDPLTAHAHCELRVTIERGSGEARFVVILE